MWQTHLASHPHGSNTMSPAGSLVLAGAGIFTNSVAVQAGMRSLAPLFSVVLIIHTTSMVTEGTMLAGEAFSSAGGSSKVVGCSPQVVVWWVSASASTCEAPLTPRILGLLALIWLGRLHHCC